MLATTTPTLSNPLVSNSAFSVCERDVMGVRKWPLVAAVIAVGWAFDQLTKYWAVNRLSNARQIDILPSLEFDLVYNDGVSFGVGAGYGALVGALVIALSGFIVWRLWQETLLSRAVVFAAILAGALGNLTDRIWRAEDGFLSGNVVDFIDVTWYAVFNVADMLVVCGCIALVLLELWSHQSTRKGSPHETYEHSNVS